MAEPKIPDGRDRREHARADVTATAIVVARNNKRAEFTIDSISLGGARFTGPLTLNRGEQLQIRFEIDGQTIELAGEVVRVDSFDLLTDHIAVRFLDVPPAAHALIHGLVARTLERDEDRLAAAPELVVREDSGPVVLVDTIEVEDDEPILEIEPSRDE